MKGCKASSVYLNKTECRGLVTTVTKKPVDFHQPIPSDKQVDSGEKHKHKRKKKKKHKSNESDVKPNMDHTAKPEQSLDHEGPYRSDNLRPRTGNSDSHERKKKKKHKLKGKACKIQIESQEASEHSLVGEMESKQMKLKCEPNDKKKRKKKEKSSARVPCLDSSDNVNEKQNLKRKHKHGHTNGTQNKKIKLEIESLSRQDDGVNLVVPGTDKNNISECHSPPKCGTEEFHSYSQPKCRREKSKKRKNKNKTFSDEIQDTARIPTSDFADIFNPDCEQMERPNCKLENLPHSTLIKKGKLSELGDRVISEEEQFFSVLHKYASMARGKVFNEMLQELQATNLIHFLEKGRWKAHEVAQLQQNMKTFKETHPGCDPDVFLFPYMYLKDRRTFTPEHKCLRREFIDCIGHQIRRPVQLVCTKAESMFFNGRRGKYDPNELSLIRKFREGSSKESYPKIAAILNRRVRDLWLKHRKGMGNQDTVHGKFTTEESKQLSDAIKSYKIRHKMQTAHKLGWVEISQDVPTRTANQCHQHYSQVLRWREENQAVFKPHMSVADRIRLIEIVCGSNAQEEAEIDWHSLLPQFPHAASHIAVQSMWHQLKLKVPDHSHKSLDEITDHLAKYELPRLEKKLERKLGKVVGPNTAGTVSSDHVEIKNENPEAQ